MKMSLPICNDHYQERQKFSVNALSLLSCNMMANIAVLVPSCFCTPDTTHRLKRTFK